MPKMSDNLSLTPPADLDDSGKELFGQLASDYSDVLLPRHSVGLGQLVKSMLVQKRVDEELDSLESLITYGGTNETERKAHPLWKMSKEADERVQSWMDKLCLNPVQEKKRAHEVAESDEEKDPYSDLHQRNKERRERSKSKT